MRLRRQTTEEFIAKARLVWGDEYDYSRVVYRGAMQPVTIICRQHGPFEQYPYNHLNGHRCYRCKVVDQTMSQAEFVERARAIFPDYDYAGVEYRRAGVKVQIICRVHGPFERRPSELLMGRGCRYCCRKPRPKRGPQFKWRPEEIEALRECLRERMVNSQRSIINGQFT